MLDGLIRSHAGWWFSGGIRGIRTKPDADAGVAPLANPITASEGGNAGACVASGGQICSTGRLQRLVNYGQQLNQFEQLEPFCAGMPHAIIMQLKSQRVSNAKGYEAQN